MIAVEANLEMADLAREVVAANDLADRILVIDGVIEESVAA